MAIELQRESLQISENLGGTAVQTVVDTDIIVPDSKPDVLRVLQVDATSVVNEKYIQKDHLTISGSVGYKILYASDEIDAPSQVKSILYSAPFSQQVEIKGIDDTMMTAVKSDVVHVEFGIQNSRKINVKTVIALDSSVVRTASADVICGVEGDLDLPYRKDVVHSYNLIACKEDVFALGDALAVPAGNPMIDEILKVDVSVDGKEIKVVNNKVVAKGNVNVCTLYLGGNGEISSMEHQLGFTEVLDVMDITADETCDVEYLVRDMDYKITQDNDGDPTLVDFQMQLSAVTKAYAQTQMETLSDVYSPDYEVSVERRELAVNQLVYGGISQTVVKDQIEIPADQPSIVKIYNVIAKPYLETASLENGKVTINGTIDAYLLYLSASADSPVYSVKKEVPFTHTVDAPGAADGTPEVKLTAEHVNYSLNSANDAEVRFVLSADTRVVKSSTVSVITDVSLDEEARIDKSQQPSITIYFAQAGDNLWDIAKRYHTTIEEIAAVNKLDPVSEIPAAQQLLIPKRKAV